MPKEVYNAQIVAKRWCAENIYEITVDNAELAQQSRAGQFLQIACGDANFLRRPISIHDIEGSRLSIIFEAKGEGTKYLSQRSTGEYLNILGPLGNGFTVNEKGDALIIGGGLGIFPLYMVAKQLGKRCDAILGYRTERMVILNDSFSEVCREVIVTTDDGTYGMLGTATGAAHSLIMNNDYKAIYACGPLPMLKAVHNLATKYGIPAQISVEERMACGFGVCLACAIGSSKHENEYLHVCKHGPVFDSREVVL